MIECPLPPKSKYKKGLERDLHNLEIRLKLQKKDLQCNFKRLY